MSYSKNSSNSRNCSRNIIIAGNKSNIISTGDNSNVVFIQNGIRSALLINANSIITSNLIEILKAELIFDFLFGFSSTTCSPATPAP